MIVLIEKKNIVIRYLKEEKENKRLLINSAFHILTHCNNKIFNKKTYQFLCAIIMNF